MVYCMSDIHGEYDRFIEMLSLIQFNSADTLYIIGDVIDRGPAGLDILDFIMDKPNIVMLLGNHEQMCLDTLGAYNQVGARALWESNGGDITFQELVHCRAREYRELVLRYLETLPDALDIVVGKQKFHLVHGMPSFDTDIEKRHDIRIWGRPGDVTYCPIPNTTTVIGHTPTSYLNPRDGSPYSIWHGDEILCIDCGCGHQYKNRCLACLRLDDMAEFYV